MEFAIDVPNDAYARAVERLSTLTGATDEEAERLATAMTTAAAMQAFDLTAGSGPVASNLTAVRAEYIHLVCLAAGRILEQREVEVILRATPASARSVITTMRATYEEALRQQLLERMRGDAQVRPVGTEASGLRWNLFFSESTTYDLARSEVYNAGFSDTILNDSPTRHSFELDRSGRGDDALGSLGLEPPA